MADVTTMQPVVITANRLSGKSEKNTGLITAEDYLLEDVYLVTPSSNLSLKNVMIEISYYEDLLKGVTTGQILVSDSISIIDRMGLCGGEYLKLSFKKSKGSSAEISKYFRIYRVGERLLNNHETENYTLHFCSDELFLSEQIKISKSYSGKKINEVVTDILVNQLRIDPAWVSVDNTEGLYDFIIPYKKPFEAINWLSSYAIPFGKTGADFVFFENIQGFNFASLQNLFSAPARGSYQYIPRNLGIPGGLARDLVGIKSYTFLDTFDSLYGTTKGAFANRLISIDPLTRKYTDTTFNYKDYFNNDSTKQLNKYSVMNELDNRFGKKVYENSDAVLKVAVTNSGQKMAEGIKDMPHTVSGDLNVEKFIPNRTAQLALSHYSRIKMSLAGDPRLTVGTTINVTLPSSKPKTDGSGFNEGVQDEYNTGKYLISSVRHIIDVNMKYETVVEIIKDSFSAEFDTTMQNKEIEKAKKGTI